MSKVGYDAKFIEHIDSSPLLDPNRNRKKTAYPRRYKENDAVAEVVLINKLCVETPGRLYSNNELWDSLQKVTVCLEEERDKDKETRFIKRTQGKGETLASRIIDQILDENLRQQEEGMTPNGEDVTTDFEEIGRHGEDLNMGLEQNEIDDIIDCDDTHDANDASDNDESNQGTTRDNVNDQPNTVKDAD